MWLPFHHLISLPSQSASDKIENTDDWILHGWKRARNWTKRKLQCTSFYNHVWGELLLIGSLKRQNWPMPCPPLLQLSALIWCEYTSKSAPPEPITHNHVCIRTSVYPLSISPCLYYIYIIMYVYTYICLITGMLHWLRRVQKLDSAHDRTASQLADINHQGSLP